MPTNRRCPRKIRFAYRLQFLIICILPRRYLPNIHNYSVDILLYTKTNIPLPSQLLLISLLRHSKRTRSTPDGSLLWHGEWELTLVSSGLIIPQCHWDTVRLGFLGQMSAVASLDQTWSCSETIRVWSGNCTERITYRVVVTHRVL